MAYQLPPPPSHEDPIVRAWLFELWKRNQDVIDNSSTIALTGDVTAPATASVNGAYSPPTTINLPNVAEIHGGDAAETFPDQTEGPYGVVRQNLTIQDSGTSLTTDATLINFAGTGVTVTEPTPDQILVTIVDTATSDPETFVITEGTSGFYRGYSDGTGSPGAHGSIDVGIIYTGEELRTASVSSFGPTFSLFIQGEHEQAFITSVELVGYETVTTVSDIAGFAYDATDDQTEWVFNLTAAHWDGTGTESIIITYPYGGGSGTGLPAGGSEGDLLVKQSATDGDAEWVTPGGSAAGEAYCPNYTSYTRQSDSTFTIDLVNAESLFRPGRRVRFTQGTTDTFGTITAVDYNSTHANDTFVTLTMEGTDTIPTGTFDVCLVTSGTSWSAISADPFSGGKIWDIATGVLSGTEWWVIVGEGGKLYTSTDGGVTWTSRTSGTTGNIKAVTYSAFRAKFYIGGVNSAGTDFYFAESTNGTTWTDLSSNANLPAWSTGDEIVRLYTDYFQDWIVLQWYDSSAGNYPMVLSSDDFTTSATSKTGCNYNCPAFDESPASDDSLHWRCSGSTAGYYTFLTDSTPTNATAFASSATGMLYSYMASGPSSDQYLVAGCAAGQIYSFVAGGAQTLEDTVGSDPIRFFAHSATHDRIVAAGDSGFLAYIDEADLGTADAWTTVSNGLEPTANFTGVEYNEADGVFVAVADNGQILRSSNGTS